MTTWRVDLEGHRATKPVRGKLILAVEAETQKEAHELARESLPGFDWTWTSLWGEVKQEAPDA